MAHTQTLEFVGTKAFLLNVYTRWRRPLEKKPESLHLVCVCVCFGLWSADGQVFFSTPMFSTVE